MEHSVKLIFSMMPVLFSRENTISIILNLINDRDEYQKNTRSLLDTPEMNSTISDGPLDLVVIIS